MVQPTKHLITASVFRRGNYKIMSIENILNTAHIHLDNATFRVHVKDSLAFPIQLMNDGADKPDFVITISRSNDPSQFKQSLLVWVCDGYDLDVIAAWISKYDTQ